jgi:DNA (cytosine-5)-methyltransferase 1
LLDLFSGAGGAGMGYHRAGFDVTGVDIKPMKRYPFEFVEADALEYLAAHGHEYDVIHASPPCQFYTELPGDFSDYPDLIAATRAALLLIGKPYIIENVSGARRELNHPIMLCGHQFGLRTYRHRLFETKPFLLAPPHLPHPEACPRSGRGRSEKYGFISVTGNGGAPNLGMPYLDYAREAMGIDWMSRSELSQSIPPAYTEFIGRHMMAYVLQAVT